MEGIPPVERSESGRPKRVPPSLPPPRGAPKRAPPSRPPPAPPGERESGSSLLNTGSPSPPPLVDEEGEPPPQVPPSGKVPQISKRIPSTKGYLPPPTEDVPEVKISSSEDEDKKDFLEGIEDIEDSEEGIPPPSSDRIDTSSEWSMRAHERPDASQFSSLISPELGPIHRHSPPPMSLPPVKQEEPESEPVALPKGKSKKIQKINRWKKGMNSKLRNLEKRKGRKMINIKKIDSEISSIQTMLDASEDIQEGYSLMYFEKAIPHKKYTKKKQSKKKGKKKKKTKKRRN